MSKYFSAGALSAVFFHGEGRCCHGNDLHLARGARGTVLPDMAGVPARGRQQISCILTWTRQNMNMWSYGLYL